MCAFYGVSKSGYYKWRQRKPSARDKEDQLLLEKIQVIHRRSRRTYGSPRIHAELQDQGHRVGRNRVARLMQIDGIRGRSADLYFANPGLGEYYAEIPNRKREVTVTAPNQKQQEFTGRIRIENTEDSSDYEYIDVVLTTPRNKVLQNNLVLKLLEQFQNMFSLIRHLLTF